MYEILTTPKVLTKKEIDSNFDGKWVYIVNAEFTPNEELIRGMPVVTGNAPFDGVEDGIYEKFKSKEYGERCSYTLLKYENLISSVYNVR